MQQSRADQGFTLVELMMVVLIIGMLIGIAIPTFVGSRTAANDRAAQTVVRHALIAAQAAQANGNVTLAAMAANEPGLRFVAPDAVGSAGLSEVSVGSGTTAFGEWVVLASLSKSDRCFALLEDERGDVRYQRTTGTCTAQSFDPASGWSDAWP